MQASAFSTGTVPKPETLRSVGRRHRHVAFGLTALMLAVYFIFILVVAYFKETLSQQVVPGLSLGILVGVAVIAFALVLTFFYAAWVNHVHDAAVERLVKGGR